MGIAGNGNGNGKKKYDIIKKNKIIQSQMTNDVYTEMKHWCIFLSINFLQANRFCFESCEISIFYPFDKRVRFVATFITDDSVKGRD